MAPTYRDLTHLSPDAAAAEYRRLDRQANAGLLTAEDLPASREAQADAGGWVRVTLPYPPLLNHYYRRVGNLTLISREGRAYKEQAARVARNAGLQPLEGPVAVSVTVFRPRKAGDIDGALKATLDAMQGHLYLNDNQIVELHAYRRDDKLRPRAEVAIRRAPGSTTHTQERLLP